MKKILFTLALTLGLISPAFALTVTPTGTIASVTYDEPVLNVDGSAMNDLDHTTIFYRIGATGTPVQAMDVAATAATGGGTIARQVTVPVGPNQEADVTFWATASDRSGNASPNSNEVLIRIDRLPPAAPN